MPLAIWPWLHDSRITLVHAVNGGIQLAVIESECDMFIVFPDLLNREPKLLQDYNKLKQRYNGKPMDEYRAAKSVFIEAVLPRVDKIFTQ